MGTGSGVGPHGGNAREEEKDPLPDVHALAGRCKCALILKEGEPVRIGAGR
jgi:hypothetical protein